MTDLMRPVRATSQPEQPAVARDADGLRQDALASCEARLRAARDLVGLAVYRWDPLTDELEWDDGLRALWGLRPGEPVDRSVFEAGIHPDDRPGVRAAIAACIDPAGEGVYALEYRVIGRDGVERWLATAGRTTFERGRPVDFVGAAVDISERKRSEAAVRESEARFRGFAEHSANLLWIINPGTRTIEYRSPAYEQIWGEPPERASAGLDAWFGHVHSEDVGRVRRVMSSVESGEVVQVEYRITRPGDGQVRWLRQTSFPIRDAKGDVVRIGAIAEDLTRHDGKQVYVVGASTTEQRRLTRILRALGLRVRAFDTAEAFLDIAAFLAPGAVLADLRHAKNDGAAIAVELRARSIPLKVVAIGPDGGDVATAVEVMKSGAVDYLLAPVSPEDLGTALVSAATDNRPSLDEATTNQATARMSRLSAREREVLSGLVDGGTNKSIALELGISPRTVELHRGQIMAKLDATSLAGLLQVAMTAGLRPTHPRGA